MRIKSGRPQTCDILNYAYKRAHCAPFKIVDIDVDVDVDVDVDDDVDDVDDVDVDDEVDVVVDFIPYPRLGWICIRRIVGVKPEHVSGAIVPF